MIDLSGKRVVISRTDSIGDVMLTLPICAWIKENFSDVTLIFLGKGYTRPVAEAYKYIDVFEDWANYLNVPKTDTVQQFRALHADAIIHVFPDKEIASLAKKTRVPIRVGTSHRSYHLLTCSHRVNFSRKRSVLHEAQLNHELLRPFGLNEIPTLEEIAAKTSAFQPKMEELPTPYQTMRGYTILHPKSQGSAKEWPIAKYMQLAQELADLGQQVIFTGTESEGAVFRDQIPQTENIYDATGKFSLEQLFTLIQKAENLVACSTGPLHIAGFLGVNTVGLYSPKRPIHPGRWKALGSRVHILVNDTDCERCSQRKPCSCIEEIPVERVKENLSV